MAKMIQQLRKQAFRTAQPLARKKQYTGEVDEANHTKVSVMAGKDEVLLWVRIEGVKSNHNEGRGVLVDAHPKVPDLKAGQVVYYHGGNGKTRPTITGRAHKRNKMPDLKAEVAKSLAETMMGNVITRPALT